MKVVLVYKRKIPALEKVKKILQERKFSVSVICRKNLNKIINSDLIVTLGGDGTVLATVPFAGDSIMLGVRAFPEKSVGFYCVSDVDNFKKILARFIAGSIKPKLLPLLELLINGKSMGRFALNEYLITSKNPAQTSRYEISVSGRHEVHRSSGIWISSGPGSGAATFNAGGRRLPVTSNALQYVVREPCPFTNESYRLLKGVLSSKAKINIKSLTENMMIYSDGFEKNYKLPINKVATIRVSNKTLKILI